MKQQEFEKLITGEPYQVFLFSAPVPVPAHFAHHYWFVIKKDGELQRWEFGKFRNSPHPKGIGVVKNLMRPLGGMNKYGWAALPRNESRLYATLGSVPSQAWFCFGYLDLNIIRWFNRNCLPIPKCDIAISLLC